MGRDRRKLKERLCESQNWRCCWCGTKVEIGKEFENKPNEATFEHIIPLCQHAYDAPTEDIRRSIMRKKWIHKEQWNYDKLAIACRKCNTRRKSTDAIAFYEGKLWLDENKTALKLWHMKARFLDNNRKPGFQVNWGLLEAMGRVCSCQQDSRSIQ
jgi:5-methylcytosine-specific restriction endonuclease McrA